MTSVLTIGPGSAHRRLLSGLVRNTPEGLQWQVLGSWAGCEGPGLAGLRGPRGDWRWGAGARSWRWPYERRFCAAAGGLLS